MPRKPGANRALGVIGAAVAGASVSYLFDPRAGRRRRALIRDKIVSAAHSTAGVLGVTSRDAANRARGLISGIRSRLVADSVSDEVVVARVRSSIGLAVSHPGAVEVAAHDGRVTLDGPVLAAEVDRLIRRAAAVPGVRTIENRLTVHEAPGNVPGLQGQPAVQPGGYEFEWLQRHWSPTARLVAGIVGSGLALAGFGQRSLIGSITGVTGLVLLARALTNRELHELLDAIGDRRHVARSDEGEVGAGKSSGTRGIHSVPPDISRAEDIWPSES